MQRKAVKWKQYLVIASSTLFMLSPLPAHSDDNTPILRAIRSDTQGILTILNNLPTYLNQLTTEALSWLSKHDDSSATADLLGITTTLGNDFIASYNSQFDNSTALKIVADTYGLPNTSMLTTPRERPEIVDIMPSVNINDTSYWALLGKPPMPSLPNEPYNYVKNASGITIKHAIPEASWRGSKENLERYTNYFRTVMAIESFNAFVLNSLAADNGNQATQQNLLIQKITSSDWSTSVATEDLGIVFRQLLLIESQNFVLMNQISQTLKQSLAAQAMTNSMLIINNVNNEQLLAQKASGTNPSM